jgi:hypothetical protein
MNHQVIVEEMVKEAVDWAAFSEDTSDEGVMMNEDDVVSHRPDICLSRTRGHAPSRRGHQRRHGGHTSELPDIPVFIPHGPS